jgi:hypothetical protein
VVRPETDSTGDCAAAATWSGMLAPMLMPMS